MADDGASILKPPTSYSKPDDTELILAAKEDAVRIQEPLSKKAQKRQLKAERVAAQKVDRRAREKAAKKEKRRERAQKRATGEDIFVDGCPRRKRPRLGIFGARVVVDLGFDDKMSDKEIVSLCSQLAYTYSANRKAVRPFATLLFTSLGGRTFTRLEGIGNASYRRWDNTEWWERGYECLWAEVAGEDDTASPSPLKYTSAKEKIVYLTADSDDELSELKDDETYIIGGICDHNRYKNLCENKARSNGIRSARLPIGKYLSELPTRKVLTVNQVFDILLQWVETRDWEQALHAVVPKRKFQSARKLVSEAGGMEESAGTADGEGEE